MSMVRLRRLHADFNKLKRVAACRRQLLVFGSSGRMEIRPPAINSSTVSAACGS